VLNVEGKTSERRKGIEERALKKGHRRKGIEETASNTMFKKYNKNNNTQKKIDETNLEHREDTEKPGYT